MFSAVQIAEYLARKGISNKIPLTMLQIMKMSYIAHGWFLALKDIPLFEENVEAWQYGAVVRVIYDQYKNNGKNPIKKETPVDLKKIYDDEEACLLLNRIFDLYKQNSGSELTRLTRQTGTPWYQVYEPGKRDTVIPNKLIKSYYTGLLNNVSSCYCI